MADTPRSSSLVENLNSRLRTYFTLRRHLGGAYLDLLRFFLNHRRVNRLATMTPPDFLSSVLITLCIMDFGWGHHRRRV